MIINKTVRKTKMEGNDVKSFAIRMGFKDRFKMLMLTKISLKDGDKFNLLLSEMGKSSPRHNVTISKDEMIEVRDAINQLLEEKDEDFKEVDWWEGVKENDGFAYILI